MKIGILTFHWSDNYGAVLQAHALQTVLQSRGHDVQIVDYRPQQPESLMRRWLSASPRGCVRKWEQNWKAFLFERFRRHHLVRTPDVFHSVSELRNIAEAFDLLITGSDQVWNPRWLDQVEGFWDLYFLTFANPNTRRISYAASIGHSDLKTLTPEWQEKLAAKMKLIDVISVREPSAVDLVQQLCGRKDAVCVADPTFMLDRAHYDKLAGATTREEPYLFSFMLHGLEKEAATACRTVAGRLRLKIVQCNARTTGLHAGYTLPPPEAWLSMIRDAKFVVTNSFHCTVFCLIFHIPFLNVMLDEAIGSMNSRLADVLKPIGLAGRMIPPGQSVPDGIWSTEIAWATVDQYIDIRRVQSLRFLERLNGIIDDYVPDTQELIHE